MAKLEVITAIKKTRPDIETEITEETLLISDLGFDSIDFMLLGDKLDLEEKNIKEMNVNEMIQELYPKECKIKDLMDIYEPKPEKNKYLSPEDYHRVWYQKMTDDGWTHGPVLSFEKREHPHILPFSNLTEERKSEIVGLLLP